VNTGQRIALLVAAVIVLVGGFVLAQGSGDEGGSEQTRTPAETATGDPTETSEGTGGAEAPTSTTSTTETQATEPAPRVETIRISGGRPASGKVRTITYRSGDTVRLRFRSDTTTVVHLHGYDKELSVPAGKSVTMRFKADAQGVFEIEDHDTDELLAKLEVRP
jgi:FtsP/CotA-like multicopper oxidase with cupredoxin domain